MSTDAPSMITNVMINGTSIIRFSVGNDNSNVSFTVNWDEPFANFDPIVNYTITINCSDASCPVMLTVTTTSASVNFITDLSMTTPLSVTASNTIGTSNPTTVMIGGKLLYLMHVYMCMYNYVCVHMYV